MSIKQFLKDWTLPVAIATGTVVYLIFYWVPQLEPASNFSNGVVNTAQGLRRVPYPVSEQTDNKPGYEAGVAALGGPDNGGTRLWWDQKPFNN